MISSNCVVCNKPLFITEDKEAYHPPCTKYWSYNEDKSKRPYCSCACGLIEYQNNNNKNDKNITEQKL